MIASTVVVYRDPSKKRVWLAVLVWVGIFLFWIVAALVIASAGLGGAKDKATDEAMKATISSMMIDLVMHKERTGSYAGYTMSVDTKNSLNSAKAVDSCVTDPITSISPDGEMVAVYVKACAIDSAYFCVDSLDFTSVYSDVVEVNKDYFMQGKASCTGADESVLPEAVEDKEDVVPANVNELGMSLSIEGDVDTIKKATEIAKMWQSDATPYALTRLLDDANLKDLTMVTFKSGNNPGKIYTVGFMKDGSVSGTGEADDNIQYSNPIDVNKLKVGSAEAYAKIEKVINEDLKLDLSKYQRVFFLSNVVDSSKGENVNAWACTLISLEDPNASKVVVVNAETGEAEFE